MHLSHCCVYKLYWREQAQTLVVYYGKFYLFSLNNSTTFFFDHWEVLSSLLQQVEFHCNLQQYKIIIFVTFKLLIHVPCIRLILVPACICFTGDSCECNGNGCNECNSGEVALMWAPWEWSWVFYFPAVLVLIKEDYSEWTVAHLMTHRP